ncbi:MULTISPECIES: DUF2924 domain-containing protein [Pseudomonadota]|jgi:hypothetical protein|uniref:Elements of external origin n=3 Tax=Pseudomonadota TaxID=1224 RepID=A0A0K8QPU5_9GAMM|nr:MULTISPECIES: DUF2924 domain-containing protein [Pseudomonadota]AJY68769.1 elements of external origin [Geobacter sulfurreducens]TCP09544.1 DUF2924 family protein [Caldimonas thermodepolymerans]UZG49565.1 DUF2924 domain-containing protein [Caldimonas thermodepolymerans]CAG2135908.1 hypothetical protein LMG6866_01356 [Ralstonia mannitolilytica]SUD88262.1 Protein of uncharacterised function (DUF2924) [Ralstonia mannitolilytica]
MNASTTGPSLAAQIANLPKLPMSELWALWDKYFPRRPPHHNRNYVEGRLAYKIQEEALGTKLEVQTQMARIGEAQSKIKTQRGVEVQVVPGTVLVREFDNREHRVTAQADGSFEYEGRRFKSLSGVARHITGTQWSGPLFFGITKTKRGGK